MEENKKLILACAASAVVASGITCIIRSRCCSGSSKKKQQEDPQVMRERYESNALTRQYMEFHFTPSAESFPYSASSSIKDAYDFPTRLAKKFRKFKPAKSGVVLDLGCAVGATSFELSKDFDQVIGIDLSEAFIGMANEVLKNGGIKYEAPDQGELSIPRSFTLGKDVNASRIKFLVGDALNIDPALGQFDAILGANLVCRVPDPEILFQAFENRINEGGILVLVSPYSWSEEATHMNKWFGGCRGRRSEDAVKARLSDKFELLDERTEPFLIRDHTRRFQLGFSHCTVWRRK